MIPGGFNPNVIKNVKKDLPKPPLKIYDKVVQDEFEALRKEGKSLLETDDKFVVFCGLTELTDRCCVHVELKNPTDKTLLFNIRRPASSAFFAKPHVGMVEPNKEKTIYLTFKGKCHRVPNDFCWIYSIYHIAIERKQRDWIKEDEFSSSNLRSVWNEKGRGEIENILHLAVKFDDSQRAKQDCKKHTKKITKRLYLNDTGDVVDAGTVEESKEYANAPGGLSMRNAPPSSDGDLPKTADSRRE